MLRQWCAVGNQGIVEILGLVAGGDEAFELFEPVEDHVKPVQAKVLIVGTFRDHQEPLAVGRDVVRAAGRWILGLVVCSLDDEPRLARSFWSAESVRSTHLCRASMSDRLAMRLAACHAAA